jgi:hypothetical protein
MAQRDKGRLISVNPCFGCGAIFGGVGFEKCPLDGNFISTKFQCCVPEVFIELKERFDKAGYMLTIFKKTSEKTKSI